MAKKIIDLEKELAELNLDSNDRSFCGGDTPSKMSFRMLSFDTSLMTTLNTNADGMRELSMFMDFRNGNNLVSSFFILLRSSDKVKYFII